MNSEDIKLTTEDSPQLDINSETTLFISEDDIVNMTTDVMGDLWKLMQQKRMISYVSYEEMVGDLSLLQLKFNTLRAQTQTTPQRREDIEKYKDILRAISSAAMWAIVSIDRLYKNDLITNNTNTNGETNPVD